MVNLFYEREMLHMEIETTPLVDKLKDCLTLTDLQDVFTIHELVTLSQDGLLEKWLNNNLLESQAQTLSNVREQGNDALLLTLCNVLDVDITKLSDYEAKQISSALKREQEKGQRERECGKDGVIVTNQQELVEAIANENVKKIYLYNEEFSIPLELAHITYDGRGNALINIFAQGDLTLDFDGNEVYFYNLTIVFHFLEPWQVKINHSSQNHNHIIFLRENRINQDNSINYYEMTSFLSGRFPFEPVSDFTERAKKFHNIIVGKAYLSSSDYYLEHELFFLQPIWRVEFIESLRRYVHGAKLVFPISSQEAKELFEQERAQLIYADFGTDKNDAVIIRLYLHADSGQGKIYPIQVYSPLDWISPTSFAGLCSGDAGYGLDLIDWDMI